MRYVLLGGIGAFVTHEAPKGGGGGVDHDTPEEGTADDVPDIATLL